MENETPKGLQNQEDVSPSEQLEKLVVEQTEVEHPPQTNGTGSNREVFNEGSLIIRKDDQQEEDRAGSEDASAP